MKRIYLALATYLTFLFLAAVPAHAANLYAVDILTPPGCSSSDTATCSACNNPSAAKTPAICQDNQTSTKDTNSPIFGPHGIVTIAVQLLTIIAAVIAIFVVIISGVRFITSTGDPNSVSQARNALLYGIIGLVIVGAAQLIVTFILSNLK